MVHEKAEKLDVSCGQEIPREGDSWEMCVRLELPVYEVVMKRSWWVKRKEFGSLTPVYGNREDDGVIYCQRVDLVRTGLEYWLWYKISIQSSIVILRDVLDNHMCRREGSCVHERTQR